MKYFIFVGLAFSGWMLLTVIREVYSEFQLYQDPTPGGTSAVAVEHTNKLNTNVFKCIFV